jgi:glycosyltransferase involved in cell wall biosynthesis
MGAPQERREGSVKRSVCLVFSVSFAFFVSKQRGAVQLFVGGKKSAMKILFVSAGLSPYRSGGLVAYVEELLDGLLRAGHEVSYLDMAGISLLPATYWRKTSTPFTRYTVFNSGVYVSGTNGTAEPLRQIYPSKRLLAIIREILSLEQPEVVHIHELLGFPVALVKEIKSLGYPVIFTAHDYYALCPTIKLFRSEGDVCSLPSKALTCKHCCSKATFAWADKIDKLLLRWEKTNRLLSPAFKLARRILWRSIRLPVYWVTTPEDYIDRRLAFIHYMQFFDLILCISLTQYNIFKSTLGYSHNLRILYPSRQTYGCPSTQLKQQNRKNSIVTFIALNVNSREKGLCMLLETFSRLEKECSNFELKIYGMVGVNTRRIRFCGEYTADDLDQIVAEADFGIVPSIWQEAFGYVGPEMLTRGLPIIVSNVGAMKEYVRDGVNGYIFDPSNVNDLYCLIKRLLYDPKERARISESTQKNCQHFPRFEEHLVEMQHLYQDLINR